MKKLTGVRDLFSTKKGIQLSINVLVLMIISIVIFSFSMYFLYKYIPTSTPEELDVMTQQAIERMIFQDNKLVAIPYNSKPARIGETVLFGLGVRNVFNDAREFEVQLEFSKAFSYNMQELTNVDSRTMQKWLGTNVNLNLGKLNAKELKKEPLGITVGEYIKQGELTKPGIYFFTIKVIDLSTQNLYGDMQEINVKVE
ncbi:hypothetical protein COV11_02570 [Candidatus Woesearchaeota archaeon CG10_big_fil_rev_8_21_14_0_10_30_7]|nr:MAG: hypothetical protein COV11_02570 [Candidatus Woesearchaeota archaeon CG10_big_fil_rev_8_21_14_0_10_30_7]